MATVSIDEMQSVYYGCNPTPHSEKAYQRQDPEPPIAAVPVIVGPSQKIVILVTSVHNRSPRGRAEFALYDEARRQVHRATTEELPWMGKVEGLAAGTKLYIQPLTLGTMAKAISYEDFEAHRGGCASWKGRRRR